MKKAEMPVAPLLVDSPCDDATAPASSRHHRTPRRRSVQSTDPPARVALGEVLEARTFIGTFRPPAVGATHAPIRIAGPGTCLVTRQGIKASGFTAKAQTGRLALFLLLLALIVGLMTYLLPSGGHFALVGGGTLGALVVNTVLRGSGGHEPDQPIELSVPWACVAGVRPDVQRGGVVIVVEQLKPSGTVHFLPEDGVRAFMEAVRSPPRV